MLEFTTLILHGHGIIQQDDGLNDICGIWESRSRIRMDDDEEL